MVLESVFVFAAWPSISTGHYWPVRDALTRRQRPLMVLKRTFVHTYVGGRKAGLPWEVGPTPEVKVNATAQNAGFLLNELRQERAVFILRPTNVRIWHKAVFKVGPVAGPKPNAIGSSKNASDPVGIPLFVAPQAPGDKPNPSEEG